MADEREGGARRFVVLFEGRSGSTHLMEILEGHPQTEIDFEPLARYRRRAKRAEDDALAEIAREQLEVARERLTPPTPACRAVGFKVKVRDLLDPRAFADLLKEVRAQIILLQRRNLVKWAVSSLNAQRLKEQTGDWNLYEEKERPKSFVVDPDVFDGWLAGGRERHQRLNQFALDLQLPTLVLYYEDLLLERERTLELLFAFLGLRYEGFQGRSIKNTSDDLRDVLTNYDELRSRYVGTEYEAMFDEVLVTA